MSHVVFLRAANVGGRNVFRPAEIALALRHLDVVNVGAAGTFVVRGRASASSIRREFLARLQFEPACAVVPASEIAALVGSKPFAGVRLSKDLRAWVAALDGRPRLRPELPMTVPAGRSWTVRFDRLSGRFALGLYQRRPGSSVYPSQVVEKSLGVPATTRWWETFERIAELAQGGR